MAAKVRHVLGLMSGTSGDGVDAACVTLTGSGPAMRVRFRGHVHRPFPPLLRRRLLAAMAPSATRTEEVARLHADLGDVFARTAVEAIRRMPPSRRPALIGLAGQTVCHLPGDRRGRTVTLQLGEAARVAAATGLTTVADFRQSDVAAGGEGAPLVPWTDWVLFHDARISRAVQNIGGIANVTWLPAGGTQDDVVAFDTGPGNMIIDRLVAEATRGRERFDRDGRRAAGGRVLESVLRAWLAHPYFRRRPPRTTGRETFGATFVDRALARLRRASGSTDDWIATATALTAHSIADAYRRFLPKFSQGARASRNRAAPVMARSSTSRVEGRGPGVETEIILCGGGARNATLMAMLAARLPGVTIRPVDACGIPAQAKEAVSFAMLAAACLDGVPSNLPQATGATRPVVLGRVIRP